MLETNEREHAIAQLTASRETLLAALQGLGSEAWTFRAAGGQWSIGDCVEHLCTVESRVLAGIQKRLDRTPEPREKVNTLEDDAAAFARIPSRDGGKFQAPDVVHPKGTLASPEQGIAEFEAVRSRMLHFVTGTEGDLRAHSMTHVVAGDLDCFQWVLLMANHARRHTQQIEEIKAAPGFPGA